jgi:outer membrane immunogenic protein
MGMKKALGLVGASLLLAGPALAADLGKPAPYKAPAPAYIASPWDGLYIGGNVGYGETSFEFPGATFHGNGVVGGFQVGYNKQYGTFVLGLETDLDLTSIKTTNFGVTDKLPWFGTTRGRVGFLLNPSWLLYATGGVAYGRLEESGFGESVKVGGVGWAAGAGVQYALTPQWSIGAEYLHVELDHISSSPGGDVKTNTDLGRATLNYKF